MKATGNRAFRLTAAVVLGLRMRTVSVGALLVGIMLAGFVVGGVAQEKNPAKAGAMEHPAVGAAIDAGNPKDVQSLDGMVAAIYEVISGPPGARNWNRFNSLFTKDARLIAVRVPKDGKPSLAVMTPKDYADRAGSYFLEHGFFEHELSRKTDSFGAMTHIYTTYESRETKDGKPIDRGINSMEFFYDGERWWCVEIYWDAERPGNPIPEKYLGK